MDGNPLFSIVTVCFNSEATIERTLRSVLQQRCKDYEYLIVDGASKDGTMGIVHRYEPLFAGRLSAISEPDKGIYDAFNKGCRKAQGKYVWIVNSDDYLEPDSLERLEGVVAGFNPDNLPIVSCGAHIVDADGKVVHNLIYDDSDLQWRMDVDSIAFVHPATLVPKTIYERRGYYDDHYRIMADLDWSRRIWMAGEPIEYQPFFVTNMYNGGISSGLRLSANIKERRYYFSKFYQNPWERQRHFWHWMWMYLKGHLKTWLVQHNIIKSKQP